jgi:hypothetical protein
MGISINTVKYHLKNLYRIMGVNNRTAAVRLLCSGEQSGSIANLTSQKQGNLGFVFPNYKT